MIIKWGSVVMGKFVLKDLLDKAKEVSVAKKLDLMWKAKGLSKESLDKVYSIYFWAIDGFASGSPTKWQVYGWKIYVINGVDVEYNKASKVRCERVLKDYSDSKKVSSVDKDFIVKELKPYFENSLKLQTGKTIGMLDAVSEGTMDVYLSELKKQKDGRFK